MTGSLRHKIRSDIEPFLIGRSSEHLSEDSDLIAQGLDSLAMMKLAAMWRRQGHAVRFADLIAAPRLGLWETLLKKNVESPAAMTLVRHDELAPFPLALMQHAYWVGRDANQHLGGVAAHFYHEFDCAELDPVRLKSAVLALFARHGMLRARVGDDGNQQMLPQPQWTDLTVYDLRELDAKTGAQRLEAIRSALSHRQLAIEQGEVFDVRLSLKPVADGGGCRLHFNLDMIAADAMSLRVLLDDLAKLYLTPEKQLPALALNYADYQHQRQAMLEQPDRRAQREEDRQWWQRRLETLPGAPVLPNVPAENLRTHQQVVRRHHWLDAAARAQLEDRARRYELTPAMLVASVFAETIAQFSDEEDFILNLPLFNRDPLHPDVQSLVGDFTSSVLLAWQGTQPGNFLERAHRLQRQFHLDAAHAGYSGVEVLRDASRLRGQQQFAPVVFTSALGLGELFSEKVQQAFGEPGWIISQGPQVWLDAQVTELNHGLLINWDARESHFPSGMLDLMFKSFTDLLTRLLQDEVSWQQPVAAVIPTEQQLTRQRANATDIPLPTALLHDAFFAQAQSHPEAPALLWQQDGYMSYGELACRARQLAARLTQEGIAAGSLVAIALPKGPEQVIAILGVLAAGAAWLPLNHQQPKHRQEAILATAGVARVIDQLPAPGGPLAALKGGDNQQLAYVIYTSGSTGEPKGVEISHVAALNTIEDLNRRYPLGRQMRTLAVSALSFDLAVYDIFAPLSVGGAIVCIDDASWRDAHRWVDLMRRHQVTVLNCVPTIAEMALTAAAAERQPLPLQLMLLGGDWVPLDLADKLRPIADACRCIALGGTTETAIHSTVQEITTVPPHWRSIPYGFPLDNVQCRVVDSLGRDRCDWVSGELWIGGAGVALGYRHDEERTADRFVTVDGSRWYRTGDLARYQPDGALEFLGRRDHQVKIRGYRIELGEIEAALIAHPGVARGIALLGNNQRLVAAYTVTGEDLPAEELRAHLQQRLPQEMVPEQLVQLAALPLSSNGKIDRAQLKQLLAAQPVPEQKPAEAALAGTEQQVATIWHQVLGKLPGRNDDFFTLGGDSLLATRAIAQLRQNGFVSVTLSHLFAHPQLADFCRALHPQAIAETATVLRHDAAQRYQPFPLTDVQQAYLFGRESDFALGGIGCYFYREFSAEDLDVTRLEQALNQLIARHDMLRAVFRDGQQQVLERVPEYRVRQYRGDTQAVFDEQRIAESARTFEPTQWPLFSVTVATCGNQNRIAMGFDNLILDALSILICYRELDALYQQRPLLLAPAIQFRDVLLATRPDEQSQAQAWAWWQPRLAEMPLAPQLPLARKPDDVKPVSFTRRQHAMPAESWHKLTAQARQWGVTPSAVMLTAFSAILRRWSRSGDFTLNLTLFDRPERHPDMARVLGDFTSLVLVPCRAGATSWLDAVRTTQGELWGALDHRQVSAVNVLRELARLHGEPELVMPVVFTSALGLDNEQEPGICSRPLWGISQTPQVWLDHQLTEQDGGVILVWDAVETLFPPGLLDAMFAAYRRLLEHLCDSHWQHALPELLPPEQRALREQINAAAEHAWSEETLHLAFFSYAEQHPDTTALFWQADNRQSQLKYGELADSALRLAHWLRQQGVEPGDKVAVTLTKGPQQAVAVLGILAAGAAYVPVGVDQPRARREAIYRRAQVRLVLNDETPLLGNDRIYAHIPPLPEPWLVSPKALAYVIFTSGSTGEPKGVEISHRAAANTLRDMRQRIAMSPQDRVLALSALDFDLSVFDLFAPLGCGAALVLVDEDHRRDAVHWHELIRSLRVSVWNSVPALLEMLLAAADGQRCPSLRVALLSGDWISLSLPERLEEIAPGCHFLALGGATEAAIWSNIFPVEQVAAHWRSIPYGYPLSNQRWRVVNSQGEDCPDWVDGELWIGGQGVAEGYLGDERQSRESFQHLDGYRWYRTGDRGRYWPDGTLEFLGRLDTQLKLRGHRIEAGEVESVLCRLPGIGQAAVSLWYDGTKDRLMAAVVPEMNTAAAELTTITRAEDEQRQLEYESLAVEQILSALLSLPQQEGAHWASPLKLDERGNNLLALWLDWLVERRLLQPQAEGYCGGTRSNALVPLPEAWQEVVVHAQAQRAQWLNMLTGRIGAEALLEDPVLSPASLSANDRASRRWLAQVAKEISRQAERLGRPLKLAELNGAAGQHANVLLQHLAPEAVQYVLLEHSPQSLVLAEQRTAASGHRIEFCLFNETHMPENLLAGCDVVLAANALHRFSSADIGMMAARQLLRAGGQLHMLERRSLTPMAMLTAGLLTGGFGGSGETSLMPGQQWAKLVQRCGLSDVTLTHDGLVDVVAATRQDAEPEPKQRLAMLGEMLPRAMVPESIIMLTHLPLTANAKIDRKRLQQIYDALPRQVEEHDALSGIERQLAQLWAELLAQPPEFGLRQGFFELGGDSLLATRLLKRIRETFAVELPLRLVFSAPALQDMAENIRQRQSQDNMEGGTL